MKEKLDELDIALSSANGKDVSLKSLTPQALESFLAVVSSLKSIITSCIDEENLKFSILEGSARCLAIAPDFEMKIVHNSINNAIEGKSKDKVITSNLRIIQEQVKSSKYKYNFNYLSSHTKSKENLAEKLISSKKIVTKRSSRAEYEYKLVVRPGYLNNIGGNTPNYHFDYGRGVGSLTVQCSKNEAQDIKQYLYHTVNSLMICQDFYREDKKDLFFHKAILDDSLASIFKKYIREYNEIENIVDKLSLTYDLMDKYLSKDFNLALKILKYLLIGFNNENFHLSELKTLLVISTPFKDNLEILKERVEVLKTYEKKKS